MKLDHGIDLIALEGCVLRFSRLLRPTVHYWWLNGFLARLICRMCRCTTG